MLIAAYWYVCCWILGGGLLAVVYNKPYHPHNLEVPPRSDSTGTERVKFYYAKWSNKVSTEVSTSWQQ